MKFDLIYILKVIIFKKGFSSPQWNSKISLLLILCACWSKFMIFDFVISIIFCIINLWLPPWILHPFFELLLFLS